jgi:hypothetical protein
MDAETFCRCLLAGKRLTLTYKDGLAGMVEVWRHGDRYVMTWEECEDGQQFNENEYTKDFRQEFDSPAHVVRYLEECDVDVAGFRP